MTGMGARPSHLSDGPYTLAVGEQTTGIEASETTADTAEGLQVLITALEKHLDGCRVSGFLGVGGVSVCFAANIQSYGDVAIKVISRGSNGGSSWLAAAAEVHCTWHPHMQ